LLSSVSAKLRQARRAPESAVNMDEIVKTLDAMIELTAKEQADDTAKKEWCETEATKGDKDKEAAQDNLASLQAVASEQADDLATTKETLEELSKRIGELDKEVAEATELRKMEHGQYGEESSLSQVAVQLIEKASNKLAKFYNPQAYKEEKSSEEALAQLSAIHRHSQPNKFESEPLPELPEYKQQNEGGIVALMTRIKGELQRDQAEAEMEEKHAQADYVSLMAECAETRAQEQKSTVERKTVEAEISKTIITNRKKTKLSKDELMNVNEYIANVHSSCDLLLQTFVDKKAAREEELEQLKTARASMAAMR